MWLEDAGSVGRSREFVTMQWFDPEVQLAWALISSAKGAESFLSADYKIFRR